jgi:predicted exporter
MTLGFGTTLIGEAVDYAIYYLIQAPAPPAQRQQAATRSHARRWLRESWPTVRLGLVTLADRLRRARLRRFPQPGPARRVLGGRPARRGGDDALRLPGDRARRRARARACASSSAADGRRRSDAAAACAGASSPSQCAATVALVVLPSPWRGQLSDLSPIAAVDLERDAACAPTSAPPMPARWWRCRRGRGRRTRRGRSRRRPARRPGEGQGVLQGYASPARFLPSPATQRARLAALPDAGHALGAAGRGDRRRAVAGGTPRRLRRRGPGGAQGRPFDRKAIEGTPLATAVDALLLRGEREPPWRALLNLQAAPGQTIDAARVRAAIASVPGAQIVSIKPELDASTPATCARPSGRRRSARRRCWRCWPLTLRNARRLIEVLLPIAAATVVVWPAWTRAARRFGILHLVGLLLTVAIGSNYALFFDHLRRAERVDEDTLASLLLANLTTVVSFALLAARGSRSCKRWARWSRRRPALPGVLGELPRSAGSLPRAMGKSAHDVARLT